MTDKIKKWLIRRSKDVKKVEKIEKVLLIIVTITLIIGAVANNDFCLSISFCCLLLAVLLRLIEIFLKAINKNKDKLLQNNITCVLLSEAEFLQEYLHYLVNWPIVFLNKNCHNLYPTYEFHMLGLLILIKHQNGFVIN